MGMSRWKVSIIVPCYNSEATIDRCLDSVIRQRGFDEFEVVCIDDGSNDRTLDRLNFYADKHRNIKVFSQINMGQAVARNKGLELATGEYVGFIDSDDSISDSFYMSMYSLAQSEGASVVVSNIQTIDSSGIVDVNNSRSYSIDVFDSLNIKDMEGRESVIKCFLKDRLSVSPCNKLIDMRLIKECQCFFIDGYFNEDMDFSCGLYLSANKVVRDRTGVYSYIQREGSTTGISDERVLDMHVIVNNIESRISKALGLCPEKEMEYFRYLFSVYLTLLRVRGSSLKIQIKVFDRVLVELTKVSLKGLISISEFSLKRKLLLGGLKLISIVRCMF